MSLDDLGTSMMQIGDEGDLVEIHGKTPTAIADLQPGRTIAINLVTGILFPTAADHALKEAIVFSSDEHVHVRYRFPAQENVAFRMKLWRNAAYIVIGNVILFSSLLALQMLRKP
jgi:hypothetical protein